MEQGYEETRFENTVDRHFQCPICLNVLRDPVQCRGNQHYFCTPCITKHLRENSQTCPTCMEELTIETLGRAARILTDVLSTFKIRCDYTERGCREMVELGALQTHVASCEFGPVVCSNDECSKVVNRQDKELHETKVCGFRMIKCDYCGEEIQFMNINEHRCPTRKEIDDMKSDLSEVKDKLNHLCSAQEEIANQMKGMVTMMNDMKVSMTNMKQALQSYCHVHFDNVTDDIVIAGGAGEKSVEIFSWTNNAWTLAGEMNECRSIATSFVNENHMIVTGGIDNGESKQNVEKMDLTQENGQWIGFSAKLPFKCYGHKTVLDHNRFIVIGGFGNSISNTIYEVSLTHPHWSKLLTHMPLTRWFHGVEYIDGKIYILGGNVSDGITDMVLMYNPITNRCRQMPPLPFPVTTMATVSWKDNVVVLGGKDQYRVLNTVIMYNVNTGKSSMLPEMRKRRNGCTAVMTGNKIVVMGGMDEDGIFLNSVEYYSFDTYKWEDLPSMIQPRVDATAVVKPVHHS